MPSSYSVLISTRDRSSDLAEALKSLQQLCLADDESAEILIVDNGSSDDTESVVRSAAKSSAAPMRYLRHEPPGKSAALNAGLELCEGEFILFTDDDVRVPTDWVQSLTKPLKDGNADGVVGRIVPAPELDSQMRTPLLTELRGWFACSDYLDPDKPVNLIGANMAIKRTVLKQLGGFDENLGPGASGFFEEVLLSKQIEATGGSLATAFDAEVIHYFCADRLKPSALISQAKQQGRSYAYVFHHWEQRSSRMAFFRLVQKRLQLALRRKELSLARTDTDYPTRRTLELISSLGFYQAFLSMRNSVPRYATKPCQSKRNK